MSVPLISIIITNYNYAGFLQRCIDSCLTQRASFSFEVLVVDDGSTDQSLDVIDSIVDPRLRVIKRQNAGIEKAANAGISAAAGEFFVRVDADDYLLPGFIEEMLPSLCSPAVSFAYSDYIVADGNDRVIETVELPDFDAEEIRARGDFLATGTVFRKDHFAAIGGYNETTRNCGLENFEAILQLLRAGRSGVHVPGVRFGYRRHTHNISILRRDSIILYGNRLFDILGMGRYRTNQYHPYKLVLNNE